MTLESGTKVRIVASRPDFKKWGLDSGFQMGQDVYVCNARGRWALIQSKPISKRDYGKRTVPVSLLEKVNEK